MEETQDTQGPPPDYATHEQDGNHNWRGSPLGARGLSLTSGSAAWGSSTRKTSP